jgi:vacuolar-type H+-ATPase subunit H
MEELLKRLLEAEARADAEVRRASAERERIIQEALDQAHRAEAQFAEGIAELREPYLKQSRDRAEQAAAELKRKYEERERRLRELAARKSREAVLATLPPPLARRTAGCASIEAVNARTAGWLRRACLRMRWPRPTAGSPSPGSAWAVKCWGSGRWAWPRRWRSRCCRAPASATSIPRFAPNRGR